MRSLEPGWKSAVLFKDVASLIKLRSSCVQATAKKWFRTRKTLQQTWEAWWIGWIWCCAKTNESKWSTWILMISVVPHKAAAEVSKLGIYGRGELLWCMDGRANPLMDRKVAEALSLSLSIYLANYLSTYLSIYLAIYRFICLSEKKLIRDLLNNCKRTAPEQSKSGRLLE